MFRRSPLTVLLLAALAIGLGADRGRAQNVGSFGGVAITAASGNVANANAVATLPAVTGRTTYLCGFTMTSSGSTAAVVVNPTVTGVVGGTLTYVFASAAGVALGNTPLIVNFNPCMPSNAANTAIVVTLPALGAGNTNSAVTAKGYYLP